MGAGVSHGADTDCLRVVAAGLSGSARAVLQVQQSGTASLGALVESWAGPDTEVFAADWQEAVSALAAAAERLSTLAKLLVEQAEEQDEGSRGSGRGGPVAVERPLDVRDVLGGLAAPLSGPRLPWVNASTALPPSMPFADNPVSRWVTDVRKKFGRFGIPMPPPPGEVLDGANDWWRRDVIFTDRGVDVLDGIDTAADWAEGVPDLGYSIPIAGTPFAIPVDNPLSRKGAQYAADEIRSYGDMAEDPLGYWKNELSTNAGRAGLAAGVLLGPLGHSLRHPIGDAVEGVAKHLPGTHTPVKHIGSYEIPESAVRVDSGKKFGWNKTLNNPEADSTYVVNNRFVFVTDDQGRVKEAHGVLTDEPGHRSGYQQRKAGGVDRLPGDEGGHIFGRVVGGPGEGINLVAMSKQANRSEYARLEGQWRSLLSERPQPVIETKVVPVFAGDSKRPDSFMVEWTKNGKRQERVVIDN